MKSKYFCHLATYLRDHFLTDFWHTAMVFFNKRSSESIKLCPFVISTRINVFLRESRILRIPILQMLRRTSLSALVSCDVIAMTSSKILLDSDSTIDLSEKK